MSDIDARLWRTLHRAVLVLVVGVAVLLVGLGSEPHRADSLYGPLVLAVALVPATVTVRRLPTPARRALRQLPRHRPMLTVTGALTAVAATLVACWSVFNALVGGTHSPLALALVAALAAGISALAGRASRRVRTGVGKVFGPRRGRGGPGSPGSAAPNRGVRRDGR